MVRAIVLEFMLPIQVKLTLPLRLLIICFHLFSFSWKKAVTRQTEGKIHLHWIGLRNVEQGLHGSLDSKVSFLLATVFNYYIWGAVIQR